MSKSSNKETFIKGALILMIANVVVKIIGATFKIPLTRLIGAEGMGLFSASYDLYALLFTIATAGFPIAVSKMVAESLAKGNEREAKRVFTVALVVLGVLGGVGSAALYFGAHQIAEKMVGNPRTALGIMAISPAVLFVAVSCAFRGYFQGRQNMLPTALSNIMEALGKLIVGYFLAFFMFRWGIEFAAAGAAYGVGFGTALSVLLLFGIYVFNKSKKNSGEKTRRFESIAKELLILAVPITLGACVQSITNQIDTFTIISRLQTIPNIDEVLATVYYGIYKGYVLPIQGIPLALVVALATPIVPSISEALALGNRMACERITKSVLRITTLFAFPCMAGIWILSGPIERAVYGAKVPIEAAPLLAILSLSILFSSLLAITNAILQANGKMHLPVIFMSIGGFVKLALNYFLIPINGIFAAPVSTNVCYVLIVSMNFIAIYQVTKIKFNWGDLILRPALASGALAAVAWLLPTTSITSMTVAIFASGLTYIAVLFLIGGLKEEDVRMLPKGDKIADLMFKR